MLQKQSVSPETLGLLKKFMVDPPLSEFFLVGGTALSLIFGHRISEDLDLFTRTEFETDDLLSSLQKFQKIQLLNKARNSLSLVINDVKVDLIRHAYRLIEPVANVENVRIASLKDLAAMKINSLTNRGAKKDFYDINALLKVFTLSEMMMLFSNKYGSSSEMMILKSMLYFEDADKEPSPTLLENVLWEDLKIRIKEEVQKVLNNG